MQNQKEKRALLLGAAANLIMAVVSWITYYYSNSEAVLLDGNYSFIIFLGVLVALKIAAIKTHKTKTFPLGKFFYESLYSFIKGLMILGILLMSVATAVIHIVMFFTGHTENIPMLIFKPIVFYGVVCMVLSYGLAFFYRQQNRSMSNMSILLNTEQKSSFVDGTLSLGVVVVALFLTMGGAELGGDFVPYLADSIFVLFLTSMLIMEPVTIIRDSLIEMAGGTLQDQEKRKYFEEVVSSNMPKGLIIEDVFISKNGSQYIILIYISTKEPSYFKKDIIDTKNKITQILQKNHPHLSLEMIPEGKAV
ncbi:cation transporter [Candidatus Contubernalis alkaliaceticus]|uniref:cation transporter n=1 Tax=Candidatus Contubernalis alkaliaceticus TaxID=338645 RepID=UPI001F4BDAB6|nr:cation transporter [Candidatus Contubernalis alkalaceticus]UNC91254.1 cation transporter [Candidatus Contubernalis alkalaceticus]